MEIIRDTSHPHVPNGVGVPEDTAAAVTEVATVAAAAVVVIAVAEAVAIAAVRALVRRVAATAEEVPPAVGILAGITGSHEVLPHLSNQQGGSSSLPRF
jgi:secreted trypsin-like serine protease